MFEKTATDRFGVHFTEQEISAEMLQVMEKSGEQILQREAAGEKNTVEMSSSEAGRSVEHEVLSSSKSIDQLSENLFSAVSEAATSQTDTVVEGKLQHKDHGAGDTLEKGEEDEKHMEAGADFRGIQFGFPDFINQPEKERIHISEYPKSAFPITDDQDNLQNVAPCTEVKVDVDGKKKLHDLSKDAADYQELFGDHGQMEVLMAASEESQGHLVEDVVDHQEFPEAPETADWEVLENPREDFEIQDQWRLDQESHRVPELTDESAMMHQEVPEEKDIFVMKDATDSGLSDFFSSGVKNDFWVSSLESGATFQPDDALNEAAVHSNPNQGFAHNTVWGTSESQNVVNGKSRVDGDSPKPATTKKEKEQMHMEAKQALCRNVLERELVNSEESEVEGETWSSDE